MLASRAPQLTAPNIPMYILYLYTCTTRTITIKPTAQFVYYSTISVLHFHKLLYISQQPAGLMAKIAFLLTHTSAISFIFQPFLQQSQLCCFPAASITPPSCLFVQCAAYAKSLVITFCLICLRFINILQASRPADQPTVGQLGRHLSFC